MLLELRNIKKYFVLKKTGWKRAAQYIRAVDGVSLAVEEGDHLGLVGESGSGKTTLGRVILKLYQPTAGRLVFRGEDMTGARKEQLRIYRRNVQMVFQDPYNSLDPRYTIRRSLSEALGLERSGLGSQAQGVRMERMLAAVDLKPDTLDRFPHEFSGGERQRIAIARALVLKPRLLILDEATSALDVLIQQQILDYLRKLQADFKLTYLLISHDLRVVHKLCRKIAVLYKGRLIEYGPTGEIFKNPLHPYTRELISAAIKYKTEHKHFEIPRGDDSALIDKGNGHFVIN